MTLFENGHFQLQRSGVAIHPGLARSQVVGVGRRRSHGDTAVLRPMTMRHVLSHTGGLTTALPIHPVDRAYREAGVGRG